jgi:hypothetical protein
MANDDSDSSKPLAASKEKESKLADEHDVDAGMVEVSLALAGLVFTAATLAPSLGKLPSNLIIFLLVLGLLTDLTAMWFLAAFCMQKGIISPSRTAWKNPFAIFHLIKLGISVYGLLAICLVFLLIGFCWVIFATLQTQSVTDSMLFLFKLIPWS